MSVLHTVNKSSFTHTTLLSCLQICGKDDGVLLLEDGAFGAMISSPYIEQLSAAMQNGVKIYTLASDVTARGIKEKLHSDIYITDYDGFVQLSIQHRCVQSWY